MSGKSVETRLAGALLLSLVAFVSSGFGRQAAVYAAQLPTIFLYPISLDNEAAYKQLIQLRGQLRADGRFIVLSYDPDAPSVILASQQSGHREWLNTEPASDSDRMALAKAIGANFYVVVSNSKNGRRADIQLVETAVGERTWNYANQNATDGSAAIEQDALEALVHPGMAAPTNPASSAVQAPVAPAVESFPTPAQTLPPVTQPTEPPTPVDLNPQPLPEPKHGSRHHAPKAGKVVAEPPIGTLYGPMPEPAAPAVTTLSSHVVLPDSNVSAPSVPTEQPASATAASPAAPTGQLPDSTAATSVSTPATSAPDEALMDQADQDVLRSDIASAISIYRQVINDSPLDPAPRLKLAEAYLSGGLRDKALDEGRRALVIDPNNVDVQQFLQHIDDQTGTSDGAVMRSKALVERNPMDPASHVALGDAFWNNNDLVSAETEYKTAVHLSPAGNTSAIGHLARLYAAGGRYNDSLDELKEAGTGPQVYVLAVQIIQGRSDELSSTLDSARDAYQAGDSTREAFYDAAKNVAAQANALSDFVTAIDPPKPFRLSHLHRIQGVDLLAQEAAVYVSYIETSSADDGQKATDLEKASQTEMLTAHAVEEKAGLWKDVGSGS